MRQLHVLRILAGLLIGLCAQMFYQALLVPRIFPLRSPDNCKPCEDPKKIRGEPCPFCGPEQVTMEKDANIVDAYKPKGMYEVTRWHYFDEEYLYDIINGLPKVKLVGSQYEETRAITQVALEYINANKMLGRTWSLIGLQNGYMRTDVFRGTDYIVDLAVKSIENFPSESIRSTFRVRLVHPFERGEQSLKVISYHKERDVGIHIIVPVSGDGSALQAFLNNFASNAERHAQALKLTLVFFKGKGKFGEESGTLQPLAQEQIKKYPKIQIIHLELEGDYNYLRAVKYATTGVEKLDIVLTLKMDMHFEQDLLQSCRLIAGPGKRAYFPIAFSQYDPDIIERGMPPGKPKNINKMDINKFTGYWMHREHDFICAYNQDLTPTLERVLLAIGSHSGKNDEAAVDEGGSKVYDSFLSENMEVISAVEPALVRIFRQRKCDRSSMSREIYQQCFITAAEMLGSKPALSILYLTEIALKKV